MNQPVALMTEADVRRYRFLIENLVEIDVDHRFDDMFEARHWSSSLTAGEGATKEDAIDDLIRQLKWEPKS